MTESEPEESRAGAEDPSLPAALSPGSFTLALLLLLGLFAGLNPIWNPQTTSAWTENVLWSYAPIPLLVGVLLKLERKLSPGASAVESLKLTFLKFGITYVIAGTLWSFGASAIADPRPGGSAPTVSSGGPFDPRPAPPSTPPDLPLPELDPVPALLCLLKL